MARVKVRHLQRHLVKLLAMDKDLKCKTFPEIEKLVAQMQQKAYWAGYIFNFIQARGVNDISQIGTLSKDFRKELAEGAILFRSSRPSINLLTLTARLNMF